MITCVRNHPTRGEHRVTCPDHPGWAEEQRPGTCRGCLPRAAERGFLCTECYERTVEAIIQWADFAAHVRAADGRLVSPEGGAGSSPSGYSNLTLSFLSLDECERLLASRDGRTVDLWVHDEDGARDAIRFAIAAEQAYQSLEVEERERELVRERCPNCSRLTTYGHVTREERGVTIVTCDFCGHELARVRVGAARWSREPTCDALMHADCEALDCRCICHTMGTQSRVGGVEALWDADQHTVASRRRAGRSVRIWREPRAGGWITHRTRGDVHAHHDTYRAAWIIQDALTIHHEPERTAA
jgi:hypothetical protein